MSKCDKVCRWIMDSTGVMSGENNISTTSSTTGASTTTFISPWKHTTKYELNN